MVEAENSLHPTRRCLDDAGRQGTRHAGLPYPEVEQRLDAGGAQLLAKRTGRKALGEEAVADGIGPQGVQDQRRGGGGLAVENGCGALHLCRQDGAGDGRGFPPAEPGKYLQRVVQVPGVAAQCGIDRTGPAQAHVLGQTAAGPLRTGTSAERRADRRRGGRAARGKPGENEQVRAARRGFHAEGERRRAGAGVQCGTEREIGGRQMRRQLENLEPQAAGGADAVQTGAAAPQFRDRGLHFARRSMGNTMGGDPVRGREQGHDRLAQGGSRLALHFCQADRRRFQPVRRPVAAQSVPQSLACIGVGFRQVPHEPPDVGERCCFAHSLGPP